MIALVFGFVMARAVAKRGRWIWTITGRGGKNLIRANVENVVFALPALVHRETKSTLLEVGKLTIMLVFIIANALILTHVLTDEHIPKQITAAMLSRVWGRSHS